MEKVFDEAGEGSWICGSSLTASTCPASPIAPYCVWIGDTIDVLDVLVLLGLPLSPAADVLVCIVVGGRLTGSGPVLSS